MLQNWQVRLNRKTLVLLIFLFITIMPSMALISLRSVQAANPSGDLSIQVITAYNFIVDSNVTTPATYAPTSAMIGAKFCNTGANALTDVSAYTGNWTGTVPGSTPGTYPTRDSSTFAGVHNHLLNTGLYSLRHESGTVSTSVDATRFIGTIPAGECRIQYWLISYPRRANPNNTGVSVTGGTAPQDDLWLEYDIWAVANDAGTQLTADQTRRATMRNEISASANKIWPNGTNKVPQQYLDAIAAAFGWGTFAPGGGTTAYPGETVTTQGIWYDFGNVGQGFDNNGAIRAYMMRAVSAWYAPMALSLLSSRAVANC
jgi:hypothetical protein